MHSTIMLRVSHEYLVHIFLAFLINLRLYLVLALTLFNEGAYLTFKALTLF